MASTFTNVKKALTTADTVVYTVPAGKTVIIIGQSVSHVGNTEDPVFVSGTVTSGDGLTTVNFIGKDTVIPKGSALSFLDGKLVLTSGETMKLKASANNFAEVLISIMEM